MFVVWRSVKAIAYILMKSQKKKYLLPVSILLFVNMIKCKYYSKKLYVKVYFYVHHEDILEINVILKNLLVGTGQGSVTTESFVRFEVYDPSGKTAYSFIREGKEIETLTEITDEIELYPGEWTYQISFAYTSNGLDETRTVVAAKYKMPQEDDIQWLLEHKLNTLH